MYLINDKGKHNKFWTYTINDATHEVIINWGRLGTKGQSKIYKFYSNWDAQRFADQKAHAKQRKGYTQFDEEAFKLRHLQSELVGAGCKIQELSFVKEINSGSYEAITDGSALADPDYIPIVYCSIQLTGGRGERDILIDPEKVRQCSCAGHAYISGANKRFTLVDVEELDPGDEELMKVAKKAPALVAALIR